MCYGHNLPPLHFVPLGKNIMGTPLSFQNINIATPYLLIDPPTSYLASSIGLGLLQTLSYALDQSCELDLNWCNGFIEDGIELDCWNLTYWLILMMDHEFVLMNQDLYWMDVGSLNWCYLVSPRGLTYIFPWRLYNFKDDIFISPYIFVSCMHLLITFL